VVNIERTNIRSAAPDLIGEPTQLVVADLSFISLRAVLGALVAMCQAGADLVVLVKPQFEAGRSEASRGRGVVKDPAVWLRVLEEVSASATKHHAPLQAAIVSPLRGGDGNVEFLFHLRSDGSEVEVDLATLVLGINSESIDSQT